MQVKGAQSGQLSERQLRVAGVDLPQPEVVNAVQRGVYELPPEAVGSGMILSLTH